MKMIYQTALLIKTHLPSAKYKLFLSSLDEDEKLLLDACIANEFASDIELAAKVYGLKFNSVKYKRIKNNLQDKIYEFTLFAKPISSLRHDEYENYLELFQVELILKIYHSLFTRKDLTLPLTKKYFNVAYKYFQHTLVLNLCEMIIDEYGSKSYDGSKLVFYQKMFSETLEAIYVEGKSTLFYNAINSQFNKTKNINKSKMLREIENYLSELNIYEGKIRSQIFHRNYYGLHMIYQHILNDYISVIELCDKLIDYLQKLPFKSIGPLRSAYKRKISHLIWVSNYVEAVNVLEYAMKLEVVGGNSWFYNRNSYLQIKIHTKNYKEAFVFVSELRNNKTYISGISMFKFEIGLQSVYLNLFKNMGAIPEVTSKDNYDVKKYLSEYNNFSKDKRGMNIPIIIAQLIEAIILRKEDYIIDRQEALKKYTTRYIRQDENLRSNCFIHMLLAVVKHNYHVVAIERHTQKYRDKLRDNPKINSELAPEIELVPYEDIWDILMEYLRNRNKKA